ncbi:MAG: Copper binding protein plastocyanin/azurin family [Gaiellales bacterium]|jgi:uncharacterized cupredoxin-like copper-binding protein|nr:Copper binding protein plastocyanin/azurin family [Gaiellales bacterium]
MRQLGIRSFLALATAVIAASALVPLASARTDGQRRATATTIRVSGGEFYFKLSTKSIAKPGKVTFSFTNAGHMQHDFRIGGKQTPLIRPGKTAKLVVTFKKKGKYTYLCTVPGHASAGMKGVFTVR